MEVKKNFFPYAAYNAFLYTGLHGFVMRQNHKILSKGVKPKQNRKILEIGGAAKPHSSIIDLEGVDEYWISDFMEVFNQSHALPINVTNKHYFDSDPEYVQLFNSKNRFSRVIVSQVWEHVNDPEGTLLKWVSLLEEDGQLDISIPCDPGWLWRLGQLIGRNKAIKTYSMSSAEIDLMMTREHVNSCQNLLRIMKYYSTQKGKFYPLPFPLSDFNLFIFFRVKKCNFNL
jgi:hypothetical protein